MVRGYRHVWFCLSGWATRSCVQELGDTRDLVTQPWVSVVRTDCLWRHFPHSPILDSGTYVFPSIVEEQVFTSVGLPYLDTLIKQAHIRQIL